MCLLMLPSQFIMNSDTSATEDICCVLAITTTTKKKTKSVSGQKRMDCDYEYTRSWGRMS